MADKTLEETIQENAEGPNRVRGDSGEVQQHSLINQIEADKYLEGKKAAKAKGIRGFKLGKFTFPGSV